MISEELWAAVPWDRNYRVSDRGRVQTRKRSGKWHDMHPRVNHAKDGSGEWMVVTMQVRGKGCTVTGIARLMWEAFYGSPGDMTVRVMNGDPHDLRLDNLELARGPHAKPVVQMDADGRIIARFETMEEAAFANGVCRQTVARWVRLGAEVRGMRFIREKDWTSGGGDGDAGQPS